MPLIQDTKEPTRKSEDWHITDDAQRYHINGDSRLFLWDVQESARRVLRDHNGDAAKAVRGVGAVAARLRRYRGRYRSNPGSIYNDGKEFYYARGEHANELLAYLKDLRDHAGKSWGQDPLAHEAGVYSPVE